MVGGVCALIGAKIVGPRIGKFTKTKAGEIKVFAQDSFTVGGEVVTEAFATDTDGDWVTDADNAMFDGYYHESYFQSAPSFGLRIDGITELN